MQTTGDEILWIRTRPFASAMLYRAFLDVYSRDKSVKFEAREWVSMGTIGMVTFDWCCESLDLDPEDIRKTVHERLKYNRAVLEHIKGGGQTFRNRNERAEDGHEDY